MATGENWREVLDPLDQDLLALHRRVVEADMSVAELRLAELRRARGVSQTTLAATLGVSQPNISRIEQEHDLRLTTLARYVAALGGRLEVRAAFPEGNATLLGDQLP